MQLEEAEALVKDKRSQAHPYIDCWKVGAITLCTFAAGSQLYHSCNV